MKESDYRELIAQVEAQIADSSPNERAPLRKHLDELHTKALSDGIRINNPGARADQDRLEDEVEAQFDNMPV